MGVNVNSRPENSTTAFDQHAGKIYNFGVYKFNRLKGAQRRILQLDFQTNVMCNVQRGHRNNQFKFEQIERVESEVCVCACACACACGVCACVRVWRVCVHCLDGSGCWWC